MAGTYRKEDLVFESRTRRRKAGPTPTTTPSLKGATYQGITRMPALFGRQAGSRQRPDRNTGYPTDMGSALATWVAARADADDIEVISGGASR